MYGREKESDELANIVMNSFHTVIYGKSGIGKTSLLRAGVFPTLRYEDFLPIYIRLEHKENAAGDYYLRQIEEVIDNSAAGLTVGTAKDGCDTLSDVFSKYTFGKSPWGTDDSASRKSAFYPRNREKEFSPRHYSAENPRP